MKVLTFKELLERNQQLFGQGIAFQIKRNGEYRRYTYREAIELAYGLQRRLAQMGVAKGERVALISENRPEWGIAYLAIAAMGAVVVPLDAMLKKEEIIPLLLDSEPRAFVMSAKYLDYAAGTPLQGKELLMEDFDQLPKAAAPLDETPTLDQMVAIVYTSGTTGSPKGVMLSHRNIMSNAMNGATCFDIGPSDNFLSVLPLHHTFETTAGFIAPFYLGARITYAEGLKSYQILQGMQETGVTIMFGVPLLYQLFFDGIMREVEEKGKSKLFNAMFTLSRASLKYLGINIGKKLFGIIHKKFGGKIRFFVSGGAPLNPKLVESFGLMGFTLLQGYGLTESSPVLTACTPKDNVIGSVGRPIPGVEIKIAGNDVVGEILGFGPNIMLGYYKRKDLTDKVIINGWLWTGDIGYLDESGHLFITGRSKDVIVTGSGVNVYPEELEFSLKKNPLFKEVCVMGEKIKEGLRSGSEEVLGIIVPNYELLAKEGITSDEAVRERIGAEVRQFNQGVAEFKRLARFIIRKEELPKTRLLKIKRFVLKKELGLL